MANKRKYTDEHFTEVVKDSKSLREVIKRLGYKNIDAGGVYQQVKALIRNLHLDTSHFLGQSYLRGRTHNWSKKIPLDDILIENSTYLNGNTLKRRLVKEGLLKYACLHCGIVEWLGVELSLHLDHINGVHNDNRLENLRLLCPNCHSLTPTYAGKNACRK